MSSSSRGNQGVFYTDTARYRFEKPGRLTLPNQHPAHLLRLADGRILLAYGIRNEGLYGVGARISEDGGESWWHPRILANWSGASDGGYPSSVQVGDGTVVTAYYCSGIEMHQRYHMGVVRWQAGRFYLPSQS